MSSDHKLSTVIPHLNIPNVCDHIYLEYYPFSISQ